MPQIAQQDYIHILIVDLQAVTDSEKAIIADKVKNGTIQDCLIETGYGDTAKVLAFNDVYIAFYNLETSGIVEIQYAD